MFRFVSGKNTLERSINHILYIIYSFILIRPFISFQPALVLVSHFVWKCSKPENKQLAAPTTSPSKRSGSLKGILAIVAKTVLGGVPCPSSREILHICPCLAVSLLLLHTFPFFSTDISLLPLFLFVFCFLPFFRHLFYAIAARSAVGAHPVPPFPCRYQQTSTCLQMSEREKMKEGRRLTAVGYPCGSGRGHYKMQDKWLHWHRHRGEACYWHVNGQHAHTGSVSSRIHDTDCE